MSGSGRRRKNLSVHFPLDLDGSGNQEFGEDASETPEANFDELYDPESEGGSIDEPLKSAKLPAETTRILAATNRKERAASAEKSKDGEIQIALERILNPVINAITIVEAIGKSNDYMKESSELLLVLNKIRNSLAVESKNVKDRFKNSKFLDEDHAVRIVEYTPYKNLLKQANDVNTLVGKITTETDRNSQLKAVADFRKTISWGTFATEVLKRLFFMLLGAAIGFVTLGYATAPMEAATAANACGVGPFVGAGAGALAGNLAYKHGLFGVMANEYRLVYAGEALVDRRNPEKGCLGVVKRGLSKF